jgi:hypothetical protein
MLPKNRFWIESLFSYFPIKSEAIWSQMVARLGFLLGVWVLGLLAYGWDGLVTDYLSEVQIHVPYLSTSFLVLFGSYFVQRELSRMIHRFRPMLKLDDQEFQKCSRGLKQLIFSFIPCLVIAVVLAVFTGVLSQFQQALTEGVQPHIIWNLFFNSFGVLLTATAIWMFASIWLTIFVFSRQPLDVSLSSETLAGFRELSVLALWFAGFYFIGVSIANITYFTGAQSFSVSEIFVSPYLFFIVLGVAGILLPFYNIHLVLVKMKERELARIALESTKLVQELDDALNQPQRSPQLDTHIARIHYRLLSLQIKEKHARTAREWPIDLDFVSKLLTLILIPIVSRILAMLIISS